MFESARQIQDWFTDCAQVITTINGKNMEWVTPLGLPVIQPYSKVLPTRNKFTDIATDLLLLVSLVSNLFNEIIIHQFFFFILSTENQIRQNKKTHLLRILSIHWIHVI